MKKYILLFAFAIAILLMNCSPNLILKNNIKLDTIGICINYSQSINKRFEIQRYFDSTLNVFLSNYNSENHQFKVVHCNDPLLNSLNIEIENTNLLHPGKQATVVTLTAMGLALPFIMVAAELPFWVAFIYLPSNYSETNVYLSWDINGRKFKLKKEIKSNPYFGSLESQKHDHAKAFYYFLDDMLYEIEYSYIENNEN